MLRIFGGGVNATTDLSAGRRAIRVVEEITNQRLKKKLKLLNCAYFEPSEQNRAIAPQFLRDKVSLASGPLRQDYALHHRLKQQWQPAIGS
jgi:hypothetical protein